MKKAESDLANAGFLLFVLSNEHRSLGDAQLTKTIYGIRFCCMVDLLAAAALLSSLALAPNAKDVITFGCWLS